MGCIYSNFEGECMVDETDDGFCHYEDDPDPNYGCGQYESDWTCPECGQDLNIEDCSCEE